MALGEEAALQLCSLTKEEVMLLLRILERNHSAVFSGGEVHFKVTTLNLFHTGTDGQDPPLKLEDL